MNDDYFNNQIRRLEYEMKNVVLGSLKTEIEMARQDEGRVRECGVIVFKMNRLARIESILSDYHGVRNRMLSAGLKVGEYDKEVTELTLGLETIA